MSTETPLKDRFEDLLADVPSYVVPDVVAAAAAGGRRRRRRHLVSGLAAAGCLTVVGTALTVAPGAPWSLHPVGSGGGDGASSYPVRVDRPWVVRDLPERPGPLAGLMESSVGDHYEWRAISPTGDVWDLPYIEPGGADVWPSLSPDGTRLAYLDEDLRFAVRDLVSGDVQVFDEISDGRVTPGSPPLFWNGQSPVHWSPSGARLLLLGGRVRGAEPGGPVVVDLASGSVTVGPVAGMPAGWLDEERYLQIGSRHALVTVDVTAGLVDETTLAPVASKGSPWSQFGPSLSADRSVLTLTWDEESVTTYRYDVATGRRFGAAVETPEANGHCEVSRGLRSPAVATGQVDGTGPTHLEQVGGGALVTLDPGLGASCVWFVADALAGEPYRSTADRLLDGFSFGPVDVPDVSESWVAWRWSELAAGGLTGLGALLVVIAWWRRRRRARVLPD